MPWTALIAVTRGPNGSVRLLGREDQVIDVAHGLLRTPPQPLVDLLDHYRTHPRDRAELADQRALDRLASLSA